VEQIAELGKNPNVGILIEVSVGALALIVLGLVLWLRRKE
jgi:hypothetical protein